MKTDHIASFDQLGLSKTALQAVKDMGYSEPTPVQAAAIPAVLEGRDVMAAAQTGTGKTAAFLLPTLDRLGHAGAGRGPLMLVVTPTRELAQQIEEAARAICRRTGHTCASVVGGVGYEPQRAALRRGCDLLVATPGRLIDLIDQGACRLDGVRVLVLDEADRMLDMGFAPAMRKIVSKTPSERQTLLFSATLDESVLASTRSLVKSPVRVEIAHKGTAAQTIEQFALGVSERDKVRILTEVLKREGSKRVIVFCRGKYRADMVCRKLVKAGVSALPIHGNRSQNQRESALKRFTAGEVGVLVATDVLARGIDVPDVAYVVNLDVPSDAEDYIHRIGRTGRAGEYGWALTFVSENEYLDLRDIEKLMGKLIPDYPRADGIDLGEDAFVLDPARKPTDKLPGKNARKKMQAERERARAAAQGATPEGASAARRAGVRPAAQGPRPSGADRPAPAPRAETPRPAGRTSSRAGAPAARPAAARPAAAPGRAGKGRSGSPRVTAPRPAAPGAAGAPRRRPGDHGGPGARQR